MVPLVGEECGKVAPRAPMPAVSSPSQRVLASRPSRRTLPTSGDALGGTMARPPRIRDSSNLPRQRGNKSPKAGTGSKMRRVKAAGNSSQGAGHPLKSRPGSPHGMPVEEDVEEQSETRTTVKPKRNVRKTSDVAAGKKKQTRTASADEKTEKRRAKRAAHAEPEDTKGGKRPPGTKPGRHTGLPASTRRASTTGEAKRRKRTGGGFAGTKRAATVPV
jgi:hypothetical protein